MKVMRLKELGPELLFGHLGGHTFQMFSSDGGICFEDGFNHVSGEIIADAVHPICFRFDTRL